ncbi:Putative phosphinothricin acetyltransferase YwnH [Bacillus sp. THAF10]|uniref:arsinothricin resistance N-acetyltransferase ArsN1 family A n=1 Tax=Bacillus sp. THAF10 TaxID=2587848 RepID=UPI001267D8FB|nr:arsinothricin resistance N-acetyltransferase ArsN1 family A [Bacillus sp. THAF10]QFT88170.1 Putative phosphinothricin acetyltransferase YwnH [Bacillus sp. THAF10]
MIIRAATNLDVQELLTIYNEGIEDRIATLESVPKDEAYMLEWLTKRSGRYTVLVAELDQRVIGWASLNPYSHRCAYDGVADLSVYIKREYRGKGVGGGLLHSLENEAKQNGFHKIVLFTFPFNGLGQGLYKKSGYREVGVFKNQGKLDGAFIDVVAMEKVL